MPAFSRRCCIHAGGSPRVTRATCPRYRGQRSGASIVTMMSDATSRAPCTTGSGTVSGCRKYAASSRATPTTHIASGRFGVIARSNTTSSRPRSGRTSAPSSASASSSRIPPWSSPSPSSRGDRSMPSKTWPRILRRWSVSPHGSSEPTPAYGTIMPAAMMREPQTTRVVPSPYSTSASWSRSASWCGSTWRMRATRTPTTSPPGASTPSTSSPSWLSAATSSSTGASAGVKSRIQDSGARIRSDSVSSIPTEEAHVVLEERADLVDAVADHRDALEAEAEREPLPLLGVDADRGEHVGVDHPAAAQLDPPRVRAHAAALAVAEDAADGELGRRLGVREEVGSEARLHGLVVEELARERLDRAEEVGHREVAVDRQALDLVEHRRMTRVERLVAVRAPGRDHVDRRCAGLHGADLHRRRVRPEHDLLLAPEPHVDRVLHRAGGVGRRDVQRLEVVPVVLHLGA